MVSTASRSGAETPSSPPDESPPDESPPDEVTIQASELETVVGKRQVVVVPSDANGIVIRRYTHQLSSIRED